MASLLEETIVSSDNQEATISASDSNMEQLHKQKTYTFEDVRGWRRYQVLQPRTGMIHDVRRRLPYYWSNITDAFTYRTIASTVRIYFVK